MHPNVLVYEMAGKNKLMLLIEPKLRAIKLADGQAVTPAFLYTLLADCMGF